MRGRHTRVTAETLTAWYQPSPERHFVIEHRRMPQMHIYLVCGLPGCETRFYLPPETRLRDLAAQAASEGWDVGVGDAVRCPDHLFGRPMQLMPATIDPIETIDLTDMVRGVQIWESNQSGQASERTETDGVH